MREQGPVNASLASPSGTILQEVWTAVLRPLGRLLRQDQSRDSNQDNLALVESLLRTLPLASDQFGVCQNRIRNARRYFEAREIGAARYELKLLTRVLRSQFDQGTYRAAPPK